jgi:hypothetical protein
MTLLRSTFLATRLAQTPRAFGFAQSITRRRFAGVVAILCYSVFQLLHALCQNSNHLNQLIHQCHDFLFPLSGNGSNFFFGPNA